jgi:putative tricarboxylic transport membrane protein
MLFNTFSKRHIFKPCATVLTAVLASGFALAANAAVDKVHFLIPGGAGGGWDTTARGTGEALLKSGLLSSVSYENLSGGGGGKAIAHLIETAGQQGKDTLMVNSTPLVIRYLYKVFPQSFRDMTPIAATVGDFGAFVVKKDSPYKDFKELMTAFKYDPTKVKFAGGSARGSMDHLVPAMVVKAGGDFPSRMTYVAYDAGGDAMAGLLSGESDVLSTGLSEVLAMEKAGEIRILAMTGAERSDSAPNVPTVKELGFDVTFVNWRGFFAAPGISEEKKQNYIALLQKMYSTDAWKEVRARYGWSEIFTPDQEFITFLEKQEQEMQALLVEMGFTK